MDELFIVGVCLGLNALFAAYEMAFIAVSKSELKSLSKQGNKVAQTLLELREDPERTLSILQIGITLVGSLAAAVGGAGAVESIEPYFINNFGLNERVAEAIAVVLIVMPLTYLNVVIAELVPKSLALRHPKKIVLAGAPILFIADKILMPVVSLLELSTKIILDFIFRQEKLEKKAVQEPIEIDSLSPTHQRFVLNMVHIEKKQVRDIIVSWEQVKHIKITDTIEEVTHAFLSSGHTRLPVQRDGQVRDVLHAKELIALRESGEKNWHSIIRPVIAARPSDSILGLLRTMQEKRNHLSIVFSSKGTPIGIVTLEDIVEEVIGDIIDEDDDGRVRKIFVARSKERSKQPREGMDL